MAAQVNMRFNSEKFEGLRFWADHEDGPPVQYLAPNNTNIEVKSDLRDLGVRVSSNLNFNTQFILRISVLLNQDW